MEAYISSLLKCVLFKNMKEDEIKKTIQHIPYSINEFSSGDIIAIEGDSCDRLGIILEGNIEIHKSFASGKNVTINHFESGNIFGEALVFSGGHIYPATIISSSQARIMFIHRSDIIHLMTLDTRILNNFMGVLSNRILMLNQRLTNLTMESSRKKMAEMLNTPRPSLSRELAKMKDDGLIDFYKNNIRILDIDDLKDELS